MAEQENDLVLNLDFEFKSGNKTLLKKAMVDNYWKRTIEIGVERNIIVYDDDAECGILSKRLVSLAKTVVRRNSRFSLDGKPPTIRMTDLYVSRESIKNLETIVPPGARIDHISGVKIHTLDSFGVGSEYNKFFLEGLKGFLPPGKQEIAIGLDLTNKSIGLDLTNKFTCGHDPKKILLLAI